MTKNNGDKTPHGRLRYTARAERHETPSRVRRVGARPRDASAYSRDRYEHRPEFTEDARASAAAGSGARDGAFRRDRRRGGQTVEAEFSRENARARYASRARHASSGGPSVLERLQAGGAAALDHKRLVGLALALLVALLLIGAAVWYVQVSTAMAPSEDVSSAVTAETPGQPYYVLVLGSDKRASESGAARADTIMLCRVDEANKKVSLVSMPRDLRVAIEGYGSGKLNSALAYNGFTGMIQAASEAAGVPISYYAVMYFSGFKKLVNDLGGVEVDVPAGTYYKGVWVNDGKEGKNVHINGKEALVLARCRHGNPPDQGAYAAGDYQRTKNQRNLMKAIVRKIMAQPVFAVPGQVLSLAQCMETNMPACKLASIALAMRGIDADEDIYSATMPATSSYIDGVSYQILDEAGWEQMKARLEAGEDPNG